MNSNGPAQVTSHMAKIVAKEYRECHQGAVQLKGRTWERIQLTTSFTGLDFCGLSMHWLQSSLADLGLQLDCEYFSATDCADAPRLAVLSKPRCQRPLHFFSSMFERIPSSLLQTLQGLATSIRLAASKEVAERKESHGTHAAKELQNYLRTLHGLEFARQAAQLLSAVDMELHSSSWCYICQSFCKVNAPPDKGVLRLEVAGSVCKPYSSMHADSWGLLDPNALPMLVWAFWCRRCSFDLILHECVVKFPIDVANDVLTKTLRLPASCVESVFEVASVLYNNPFDFGIPKRRARQFARWRQKCAFLRIPGVQFDAATMSRLFYRQLFLNSDIFLQASASQVQGYYLERALARGVLLSEDEVNGLSPISLEDVIPPCARVHLAETKAQEYGIRCVHQSPHLYGHAGNQEPTSSHLAPPLLTNSLFYSCRESRLLIPDELLLLQGLPSCLASAEVQQMDPWSNRPLIEVVGERELRQLLGNGMDMSQISAALCLLLLEASSM